MYFEMNANKYSLVLIVVKGSGGLAISVHMFFSHHQTQVQGNKKGKKSMLFNKCSDQKYTVWGLKTNTFALYHTPWTSYMRTQIILFFLGLSGTLPEIMKSMRGTLMFMVLLVPINN